MSFPWRTGILRSARRRWRWQVAPRTFACSLLAVVLIVCGRPAPPDVQVLRLLPHDRHAYTQGLVFHDGRFYESTGRYGESSLREVDVETGQVLRLRALERSYFGEGLALVGSRLIQLTWQEGVAFIWDAATFELEGTFEYEGEGWGLCHDGEQLFMTTGGSLLYRRDPASFEVLGRVQITLDGLPLNAVNELACVGDHIYGNVFMTDRIARIDKHTGVVTALFDASGLLPRGARPPYSDAVLNGIAHDPDTNTFYLTGKLWPLMFQVRFVEP